MRCLRGVRSEKRKELRSLEEWQQLKERPEEGLPLSRGRNPRQKVFSEPDLLPSVAGLEALPMPLLDTANMQLSLHITRALFYMWASHMGPEGTSLKFGINC